MENTDDNPGDIEKGGAESDGMDDDACKSAAGDGSATDISGGPTTGILPCRTLAVPSLLNRLKQLGKQNASY